METVKSDDKYAVHKFGGTSVGNSKCFEQVREIVLSNKNKKLAVVVSGMGGKPKVTDMLLGLMELAKENNQEECNIVLNTIRDKHLEVVEKLLDKDKKRYFKEIIDSDIQKLQEILRAVSIMRIYNHHVMDLVCGHGELWSAQILTEVLNARSSYEDKFMFVDAREVLVVEQHDEQGPQVLWEESIKMMNRILNKPGSKTRLVITGFVASTLEGIATTLKRDGSDFSASIFARLLHASSVTIWTDVNGVLSADPRRVPEAKVLAHISYEEAMELAYFGAKVIHPKTMKPAIYESIPIIIRNTFSPDFPGTCIYKKKTSSLNAIDIVSGFSTVDNLSLCNLEGSGMLGVHGVASRLFGALDRASINVVLIAQASSEHSICFAIPMICEADAKEVIENTFFKEIHHGDIDSLDFISPVSIIAAVGDNMSQTPGVCGKFFNALGRASINILGISQGSSERNISAVVRFEDSARALRAVHSAFFLSDQTISIGIIGRFECNSVGSSLIQQIHSQQDWLLDRYRVDLRIRGFYSGRKMALHETGFDLSTDLELVEMEQLHPDLDVFVKHIQADHIPHWLIVDITSSNDIVKLYSSLLESKTHIVSSNLSAASCSFDQYRNINIACCQNNTLLKLEACVGAGLPVLSTIQSFLQTGDRICRIEGQLSSITGDILNTVSQDSSACLSAAVQQVLRNRINQVEPLLVIDELSGLSSAKKAMLLGREIGMNLDFESIELLAIIDTPKESYAAWGMEEVINYIAGFDEQFKESWLGLRCHGSNPKLITQIDSAGKISVRLSTMDETHPFTFIQGSLNALAFYTDRYSDHPLVVQGPSSRNSVVAGALFTSILNLSRELGARDHGGQSNHANENWVVRMSPSQSLTDLHLKD